MSDGSFPTKESLLAPWSENLSTKVSAAPTAVGLTAGQATSLASATTTWTTAYGVAITPETRTKGSVAAKNTAKNSYFSVARPLINIIQAFPGTTNEMREDLGLKVRDGEATPINPPTEAPICEITSVFGKIVKGRVHAIDEETRGKPSGVAAVWLWSFLGSAPSAEISDWKFEGASTRTSFEIQFPPRSPLEVSFGCARNGFRHAINRVRLACRSPAISVVAWKRKRRSWGNAE